MAASENTGSSSATTKRRNISSKDTGRLPLSPLGATPRSHLKQEYIIPHADFKISKEKYFEWSENAIQHTKDLIQSPPRTRKSLWTYTEEDQTDFTKLKNKESVYVKGSTRKAFLLLGLIFVGALVALGFVYLNFPKLQPDEKQHIKLPRNIDDAKNLGRVLSRYKDNHYTQVIGGFFLTYIFLQSFAIPGSIFLSILSGFLFPFTVALFLVCLCSGVGASFCYCLSYLVGRKLVQKYIPNKAAEWQVHVNRHREHLLNYIIFLRITPFLPNWFINITSPVIEVPLAPFFFGTFLGVAPPSFVAIQAGTTLHELTSSGDAVSWTSVTVLGILAILSLLPVFFKKTLQKKFD